MNTDSLQIIALQAVAILQGCVAILNLSLVRLLHWEKEIARMDLLLREVFQIHSWYISLTMGIFTIMTWRFASEMALGDSLPLRWLCCLIGLFWGLRVILQWTHYSSSHWRGRPGRTLIHYLLLTTYTMFTAIYGFATIG